MEEASIADHCFKEWRVGFLELYEARMVDGIGERDVMEVINCAAHVV